jgi:hypothetical protein
MKACAHCGVPVADDQRYCLECGGRQMHARSQFLDRFTPATVLAAPAGVPGEQAQQRPAAGRSSSVTILASVGVLLLAMGVGILIGRAGAPKTSAAAPPQVISVSSPGAGTAGATTTGGAASTEAGAFPEDWPAGKSGYAVQLQTLPAASAQASEVTAAKTAALAKGASGVGVLLSSNFHSLPSGQYVIYSGDYPGEAQAKQALGPLKAKFPAAAVIHVTEGSASSSSAGSSSSSGGSSSTGSSKGTGSGSGSSTGGGKSGSQPSTASPKSNSGQSFEQKSRNLPNVVSTG